MQGEVAAGVSDLNLETDQCRSPPVTLSSRHVFVECSLRKVVVDSWLFLCEEE